MNTKKLHGQLEAFVSEISTLQTQLQTMKRQARKLAGSLAPAPPELCGAELLARARLSDRILYASADALSGVSSRTVGIWLQDDNLIWQKIPRRSLPKILSGRAVFKPEELDFLCLHIIADQQIILTDQVEAVLKSGKPTPCTAENIRILTQPTAGIHCDL
jgi:hypothetical protein